MHYMAIAFIFIFFIDVTLGILRLNALEKYITWDLEACNFTKKETLAQVLSCEFCEISKNTFFYRTPLVADSKIRRFEKPY